MDAAGRLAGVSFSPTRTKDTTMAKRMIGIVAMVSFLPTALSAQRQCEFRDDVELRGTGNGNLHVEAGAGRLTIASAEATGVISVSATLCASDRERLEGLEVSLDGDRIRTDYPNQGWGWGNNYARIDLAIEVPAGTNIYAEDSSGSLTIYGVGDVELKDGSGSAHIENVGSVLVEDGSGSLRIQDANGDVEVRDGSGSMTILRVGGGVMIEDGSGSIEIEAVAGSVRIDEAGAGGVRVRDVDGDLIVTDGRRERIRYSDIRGVVDLPPAKRRGRDIN